MFLSSSLDFSVSFEFSVRMSYLYSGTGVVFLLEKLNRFSESKR